MKFVRQISGPYVMLILGNYIFGYLHDIHIGYCSILGPILCAVTTNGGSANRLRIDRFENFQHVLHKTLIKGGPFIKTIANSCFGAPQCGGLFWTNWGVCQSAQMEPIWTLNNISCTKFKFKGGGGIFNEKNYCLM